MFDKGAKVTATTGWGTAYRKGDTFISYGRHPTENGYFAIRLKADYLTRSVEGHNCDGLIPEGDGWWVEGGNFIEEEAEEN